MKIGSIKEPDRQRCGIYIDIYTADPVGRQADHMCRVYVVFSVSEGTVRYGRNGDHRKRYAVYRIRLTGRQYVCFLGIYTGAAGRHYNKCRS